MRGIRVSDKHGVNPSLDKCFWCGEARGVVLLGRLHGDEKAPGSMVLNYDPCDACRQNFAKGIHAIEVFENPPNDRAPLFENSQQRAVPTGRWAIVKPESRVWEAVEEPARSRILEAGKCVLEERVYEAMGFAAEPSDE